MNYIELINQFWQCDIEHSFNGSETRLYFYLLHTCNSLRWKNPFTHSDAHLAAVSGMSVNTLKTARNRLKQAGLLEFTAGSQGRGQSHKAQYKLSIFDTIPDTLSANSLTVFPRTSDSINKHKLNEEEKAASADAPSSDLEAGSVAEPKPDSPALPAAKPTRSPKKPKASADEVAALPLPHPGAEFAQLWADFRAMPKQVKKPLTSLRRLLATLGKYAEGYACLMLEKAIEGNWSGVEFDGTAEAYAKWQAEQARRPSPAPASFDPDALFGYTQSAAEGLAQARQDPDYQRYLAELAQEQQTTPPPAVDAALAHAA